MKPNIFFRREPTNFNDTQKEVFFFFLFLRMSNVPTPFLLFSGFFPVFSISDFLNLSSIFSWFSFSLSLLHFRAFSFSLSFSFSSSLFLRLSFFSFFYFRVSFFAPGLFIFHSFFLFFLYWFTSSSATSLIVQCISSGSKSCHVGMNWPSAPISKKLYMHNE